MICLHELRMLIYFYLMDCRSLQYCSIFMYIRVVLTAQRQFSLVTSPLKSRGRLAHWKNRENAYEFAKYCVFGVYNPPLNSKRHSFFLPKLFLFCKQWLFKYYIDDYTRIEKCGYSIWKKCMVLKLAMEVVVTPCNSWILNL